MRRAYRNIGRRFPELGLELLIALAQQRLHLDRVALAVRFALASELLQHMQGLQHELTRRAEHQSLETSAKIGHVEPCDQRQSVS